MTFQPVKCNMMQLTNKRINKIEASYTLEGTVLESVHTGQSIRCIAGVYADLPGIDTLICGIKWRPTINKLRKWYVIILLFFSYSLFQNISYAKGTIELYRKDVRGMHLVIYLSI